MNNTPRVVHFSSVHVWHDTRVFRRMCRSLAASGYDVHLVAACDDQPELETHDGVHVHVVPKSKGRLGRMITTARAVVTKAAQLDAALYHFHDPELIPFAWTLAKSGRPVIYDAHEDLPKDLVNKEWLPKIVGRAITGPLDWLERLGTTRFAAVVAAEEAIESRFKRSVPDTVTLHNYPSLQDFPEHTADSTRHDPPTVVHFGGLSHLRAIEPLVDAMDLLPADLEVKLLAAGRCESDAMMTRLQGKPGWKRVEYLGWLGHDALRQHLRESSLAMNLFSDAPNHLRIRSNRFFESLACGIPVITSDLPAWKAMVGDLKCGMAVDANDPSEIANAITRLLTNRDEAQDMGRRGREAVVAEYNWDAEFLKLQGLYERLLGRSPVGS